MSTTDAISWLQEQFGIEGVVAVEGGLGGLPCMHVTAAGCTGTIYLHGAHVTSYCPAEQRDVLFVSGASRFEEGRAIRGGVPICFPWFADNGPEPDSPSHGLVRTRAWELASVMPDDQRVTVEMSTELGPFGLTFTAAFGAELEMTLAVTNRGDEPAGFEEALHTYFAVSRVQEVTITGLEGVDYIDKVDGGARRNQGDEAIRIAGETDRIYQPTRGAVTLTDRGWGRRVIVDKRQSESTVVWNPWIDKAARMSDFGDDEWPGMVCIETCNVGDNRVALKPGATHAMSAVLRTAVL